MPYASQPERYPSPPFPVRDGQDEQVRSWRALLDAVHGRFDPALPIDKRQLYATALATEYALARLHTEEFERRFEQISRDEGAVRDWAVGFTAAGAFGVARGCASAVGGAIGASAGGPLAAWLGSKLSTFAADSLASWLSARGGARAAELFNDPNGKYALATTPAIASAPWRMFTALAGYGLPAGTLLVARAAIAGAFEHPAVTGGEWLGRQWASAAAGCVLGPVASGAGGVLFGYGRRAGQPTYLNPKTIFEGEDDIEAGGLSIRARMVNRLRLPTRGLDSELPLRPPQPGPSDILCRGKVSWEQASRPFGAYLAATLGGDAFGGGIGAATAFAEGAPGLAATTDAAGAYLLLLLIWGAVTPVPGGVRPAGPAAPAPVAAVAVALAPAVAAASSAAPPPPAASAGPEPDAASPSPAVVAHSASPGSAQQAPAAREAPPYAAGRPHPRAPARLSPTHRYMVGDEQAYGVCLPDNPSVVWSPRGARALQLGMDAELHRLHGAVRVRPPAGNPAASRRQELLREGNITVSACPAPHSTRPPSPVPLAAIGASSPFSPRYPPHAPAQLQGQ